MNSIWVTWPSLVKLGTLGIFAGLITLAAERQELFKNNLFDFERWDEYNADINCDERSLNARTENGTCNILENPSEGSVMRRFGRNVELSAAQGETEADTLLTPNPREVSNVLLSRGDDFKPATSVNFIAASWIQFMTHDWFFHGENSAENPIEVPLPAGDSMGSGTLKVRRTQPDTTRIASEAHLPDSYQNHVTHWWDGSQIYGSDLETSNSIREFQGGRLTVNADGTLPREFFSGLPKTGFVDNWWVGLSMLHQLFVKEHNAIAETLAASYPDKDDQWLYDKARLVNSALMAKIHTVEWTPAIIANPVTERAMYANWWGLAGDANKRDKYGAELDKIYEDLAKKDSWIRRILGLDPKLAEAMEKGDFLEWAITGLAGARKSDNAGVPFTLTEEFVSVYRMHPLMRDNIDIYDIGSNVVDKSVALEETRDGAAEDMLDREGSDRLWYSFGITNPGALVLNNNPEFLRNLDLPIVGKMDIAAIDVIRDRERGVPRYNEFRRQIGLNPITKFEDLTKDPKTLADLKRLYNNNVEMIDTLVGMMAETVRPEGFAFGETAFQIFIMNASRRIIADRFFTSHYTPEVYTQEGYDWVENNTMVDVLNRHFPQLNTSLVGVDNAFKPWGLNIPADYDQWDACAKQELLWTNGVKRTTYAEGELPAIPDVDTRAMISRILWDKVRYVGDVAPVGHTKPIHPHGAVAKVAFNATANHPYTGVFKGNECGLLRMSVTGDPAKRGVQPGLAWKTFIDGKPSENVAALYTLTGQGNNYNLFANELSQYVRPEANDTLGSTILFSLVTTKPTQLMVNAMAEVNSDGSAAANAKSPTQIYFVPAADVKNRFSTAAHDFRTDLLSLPAGTKLYDVYATDKSIQNSIFSSIAARYASERRNSAVKVGEIVLTSEFAASAFGDSGIFFKHQRYEDR
ncbi:peroxidase [Venatoribacter cucullus]|uniref:Peroxidase n=1 Tax=Venatoribacter cucullus TaxID=2661630 RepID=A0A9X7UWE2_9GAMM|nr:peroxidase family protein [Venatoribacter cucullus]QQD24872.1 peroxidase [Venatoribacter cucullus]